MASNEDGATYRAARVVRDTNKLRDSLRIHLNEGQITLDELLEIKRMVKSSVLKLMAINYELIRPELLKHE